MTSPLQRSKKLMESINHTTVAIVERWNPWAKIRQDLFGIIDLLGVNSDGTWAVQVTTLGHMKDHRDKMQASPMLEKLKKAGWVVELHGWRKLKAGWAVNREVL